MGVLTHPVVPITTAAVEGLSGDYQFWQLENPDTNANSIFYNPNATATTTATQSKAVRPGQTAFFFANFKENPNGVSLIAATGATTVNLTKETFRTRLGYQIAVFAAGVAASVANLWQMVPGSSTAIQPVASVTGVRADSLQGKTVQGSVLVGVAGNPTFAVPTLIGSSASDYMEIGTNGFQVVNAGSGRLYMDNTGVLSLRSGYQSVLHNGAGTDPRHTMTPAHRVLHTPIAGGGIDSVLAAWELPPVNGTVIAVGDLVMKIAGNQRVTPATTANTTMPILGVCVVGATGNAGGTTFARIAYFGQIASLVADAAGVVDGQFIKPGTTTLNRAESQTTPSLITFGRADATAASTVAFSAKLRAMG